MGAAEKIYIQSCELYTELLTDTEKEAWRIPEKMTVSEWAERYRFLGSRGNAEGGPWNNARTPYLREIMDAWNDPDVYQITFKKPTQIGGTEAGINAIGYVISHDPGPTLVVLPKEDVAKTVSRKRIWPLITETECLERFLPDNSDDLSRLFIGLTSMDLRICSAESPSSLASDPIKYLILDEVNKYPRFSGREADPISLAKERQNTFKYDKKCFVASTPTVPDAPIDAEYKKSDQRQYFVPCPHCGTFQTLAWSQVKFKSEDGAQQIQMARSAHYECRQCSEKIEDHHKEEMLARGVWCPKGCTVNKKGKILGVVPKSNHRGYWINAIYSPWLTFSDLAAEFLEAKRDVGKLMNFVNSKLAEEFEEKAEETTKDAALLLIGDYPPNMVPEGALVLIGSVDVQKDHFWLRIRGWGLEEESWGILEKRLETWKDVETVLFKTDFKKMTGAGLMQVTAAGIDTGYRTNEVYAFCSKWRGRAFPVKGQETLAGGRQYSPTKIERLTSGESIPGGVILWHVNKYYYNDKLSRFLHSRPGDIGQFHLHGETDDVYLSQLVAEKKVPIKSKTGFKKFIWKATGANHFRDCEVYGMAVADILRVWALREEDVKLANMTGQAVTPQSRTTDDFVGAGDDFGGAGSDWI